MQRWSPLQNLRTNWHSWKILLSYGLTSAWYPTTHPQFKYLGVKSVGTEKRHGARNQLRLGYWFRVNSITIGWMASVSRAVSERSAAWVNAWLTWMQEPQGSAERNCLGWLLQISRKAHAMHGRWKLGAGGGGEGGCRISGKALISKLCQSGLGPTAVIL